MTVRSRTHALSALSAAALVSAATLPLLSATATASTQPARTAARSTVAAVRALPTAAARAAGISRVGDAYMGWKNGHLAMKATIKNGRLVLSPAAVPAPAPTSQSTSAGPLTSPAGSWSRTSSPVWGMDVSHWQGSVPWSSWYNGGRRFAYVKATEGTSYISSTFSSQYSGAASAGMMHGAYHYGLPSSSAGSTQADFFVSHGGGWSRDGRTLPGVLDIEYNPYGSTCYGMSSSSLVSWVKSFLGEYHHRTGRDAVIYTAYNFWVPCLGNSSSFSQTNPLWVASYSSSAPTSFGGWPWYTFQQYTDVPLDKDLFNGSYSRLQALANG